MLTNVTFCIKQVGMNINFWDFLNKLSFSEQPLPHSEQNFWPSYFPNRREISAAVTIGPQLWVLTTLCPWRQTSMCSKANKPCLIFQRMNDWFTGSMRWRMYYWKHLLILSLYHILGFWIVISKAGLKYPKHGVTESSSLLFPPLQRSKRYSWVAVIFFPAV